MPEILEEIDAYKHMLRVAEDLLHYAGLPEDLIKKFHLLKEKTFHKVRLTKEDLENSGGHSSQSSKAVIEDFATFFEHLFSSQNTLYERLQNIAAEVDNKQLADEFSSFGNFGLLRDNRISFTSKLTAFKGRQEAALRASYESLITTHLNRFERLEQQGLDIIKRVGQIINKQGDAIRQNQYQIESLQTTEQKLKLEIDMLMSRLSQNKQLQAIELLEKNQELSDQVNRLNERITSLRATHLDEINHIKNTYEIQLGELREKAFELGNQLHSTASENERSKRDRMDDIHRELAEKTKQIDHLSTVVKYLRLELKPLYDKHMKTHYKSFDNKSTDRRKDEHFDMISFIAYLIQKFENDNIWLVEKLTELGNENETLKTKCENLSTTRETQKQELDAIFRQLRTELQDSKYAFMEWESSIDALKRVLDEDPSINTSMRTSLK